MEKLPEHKTELIDSKGLRADGRKLDQLRPIKLEVGILDKADGSAYIEQARTRYWLRSTARGRLTQNTLLYPTEL